MKSIGTKCQLIRIGMSWKKNVYKNRMLMNSGKLMDGQICVGKKKKKSTA